MDGSRWDWRLFSVPAHSCFSCATLTRKKKFTSPSKSGRALGLISTAARESTCTSVRDLSQPVACPRIQLTRRPFAHRPTVANGRFVNEVSESNNPVGANMIPFLLMLQVDQTTFDQPTYFTPVIIALFVLGTVLSLIAAVLGFARARA